MKNIILFGAGASFGHTESCSTPALGLDLFKELMRFSDSGGNRHYYDSIEYSEGHRNLRQIFTSKEISLFEESDFELAMASFHERTLRSNSTYFNLDLCNFHEILAGYLLQFQACPIKYMKSRYYNLAIRLKEYSSLLGETALISLNYDILLEGHLHHAGIHSDYSLELFLKDARGSSRPSVKVLKPHGSINFASGIGVCKESKRPLEENDSVQISELSLQAKSYLSLEAEHILSGNIIMAIYAPGKHSHFHNEALKGLREETVKLIGSAERITIIGARLQEDNVNRDPFLSSMVMAIPSSCELFYIGDRKSYEYLRSNHKGTVYLGEKWEDKHSSEFLPDTSAQSSPPVIPSSDFLLRRSLSKLILYGQKKVDFQQPFIMDR